MKLPLENPLITMMLPQELKRADDVLGKHERKQFAYRRGDLPGT
jgi:hypothetical protein